MYAQYDAVEQIRRESERELVRESHRFPASAWIESIPGLGGIRTAQLLAIVVDPARFATRAKFWSYCGLGLVTRSSSDWVQGPDGKWARAKVTQTRGLNVAFQHQLKNIFKGAATTVIAMHGADPLHADYRRMLDNGTKPSLARVTLARKIAAIALAVWRHKEVYDPTKRTTPSK